jgi:type I restriction enzyme S subunit
MKMTAFKEHQKDSGDWFRELPNHWSSKKAKWVFDNLRESFREGDVQLAASQKYGVIPQKLMMEMNNANVMQAIKGTDNFKRVKNNDFVISLRSFEGGIEISHYDGCISPAYTVLRLSDKQENYPGYFRYALKESVFIQALNSTSEGIRDGKTITYSQFRSLNLCVPPFGEQKAISCFLNRETKRIDSLIDEKQSFINLLKEKRQALISNVVTKGLDSDVEMKDSGVEWIGEIPKHWEIKRLRYVGRCQNGINIGGEFFGKGFPFISYGDVYKNRELPEKPSGLVQSSESDRQTYKVQEGDVLFTRTSETIDEIGFSSVCMSDMLGAVFAGFLIRFRPNAGAIHKGYSKYYFQNELLRAFFVKEMNLVTRASLSQELLKRMPVALPPEEDQALISKYLDKKCSILEHLISETKRSIDLLKEHRTALISAAVTGKIDLRDKEVA